MELINTLDTTNSSDRKSFLQERIKNDNIELNILLEKKEKDKKSFIINSVIKFGNNNISVYGLNTNRYFRGNDICMALRYGKGSKVINDYVRNENKIILIDLMNNLGSKDKVHPDHLFSYYINQDGIFELLDRVTKPGKEKIINFFSEYFNIEHKIPIKITKQSKYLQYIIDAFKHTEIKLEYYVKPYRIDLYFVKEKIAVECDEFGHKSKNKDDEKARENHIINVTKCTFVRFNPDAPNFQICDVIEELNMYIGMEISG